MDLSKRLQRLNENQETTMKAALAIRGFSHV